MAHTCVAPLEFIDRLHPYLCGNCEQWFLKLAQHKRKCPNRDVRSITIAAVAKVSQTHDDVTPLTWNADVAANASSTKNSAEGSDN